MFPNKSENSNPRLGIIICNISKKIEIENKYINKKSNLLLLCDKYPKTDKVVNA